MPLRFPGQYYDAETDLFQNWNRFYDANTRRYLEPELLWLYPEKLVPIARQGKSRPVYAYAGNNPITGVDPDGQEIRYWGSDNQMISASSSMEDLAAYALALDGIASATSSSD